MASPTWHQQGRLLFDKYWASAIVGRGAFLTKFVFGATVDLGIVVQRLKN